MEEWNRRRDRYQRFKELTAADNDDDVYFEGAYSDSATTGMETSLETVGAIVARRVLEVS